MLDMWGLLHSDGTKKAGNGRQWPTAGQQPDNCSQDSRLLLLMSPMYSPTHLADCQQEVHALQQLVVDAVRFGQDQLPQLRRAAAPGCLTPAVLGCIQQLSHTTMGSRRHVVLFVEHKQSFKRSSWPADSKKQPCTGCVVVVVCLWLLKSCCQSWKGESAATAGSRSLDLCLTKPQP